MPGNDKYEKAMNNFTGAAKELRAGQAELLRGIINYAEPLIFAKDLQGRFILVSQSMADFYGYKSVKEMIGKTDYDLHPEEIADQFVAADLRVTETKTAIQLEEKVKKGGRVYIYLSVKFPLFDSDGQVYAVCGMATDITDRVNLEEEVDRHKSLLEITQRISKVGGWEFNVNTNKMTWTKETYTIHGLNPDQLTKSASILIEQSINCYRPEDRTVIMNLFTNCIDKGIPYDMEFPFTDYSGKPKWIRTMAEAEIVDGKTARVLGNIADITELKNARETLIYLSFHDQLTGLYNRRYLEEELTRLDTSRQLPLAIIVSDLNNLKQINDLHGHGTGDEMIKTVAEVIKQCCREEDIVARWGGDEFIILLPQTDRKAAETICRRILEICGKTCVAQQPVSIALGLAVKKEVSQKSEDLFAVAEKAMYEHKNKCRSDTPLSL